MFRRNKRRTFFGVDICRMDRNNNGLRWDCFVNGTFLAAHTLENLKSAIALELENNQ